MSRPTNKQELSPLSAAYSAMLPNLLRNLPGMVYRCLNDSKWTMLYISEGCCELTGFTADELISNANCSYYDVIFPEDREFVNKAVQDGVRSRTHYQMEYRIETKDGSIKWVMEKGNAVYDEHDNVIHLDGFISDITARKRAEEELKKAASDMVELNATKDRFLSLIAHDLQNPVYAIVSLSDFIYDNQMNFETKEISEFLLQINSAAKGIYTLLENLLDWARLQTNTLSLQRDFFSVSKAIHYAMDHFAQVAAQKDIDLIFYESGDVMIENDLRLVSSILRNLLSNAIKYSFPGSKVVIRLDKIDDWVSIQVIDKGIGISRRHMQKIFRIDNEYRQPGTANETGSGLGLILVHGFAELIGAQISVESKLNQGSQFKLKLKWRI